MQNRPRNGQKQSLQSGVEGKSDIFPHFRIKSAETVLPNKKEYQERQYLKRKKKRKRSNSRMQTAGTDAAITYRSLLSWVNVPFNKPRTPNNPKGKKPTSRQKKVRAPKQEGHHG